MATIHHLSAITIRSDRQRQHFDAQGEDDLRTSIETHGLMHPIVVRVDQGKMILVAGETRIRVCKDIWALGGEVRYEGKVLPVHGLPVSNFGEVSELQAEEMELDENLKRKDLTWQERAEAEARLHKLRVKQSEAKIAEVRAFNEKAADTGAEVRMPEPKPHTLADTAKEVYGQAHGGFQVNVRKNVILADHLSNPVIAKAKTADEAYKLLKKQEEAQQNRILAATVGETFSLNDHTLLQGSCLDLMKDPQHHGRYDCILTDPPYGMGAQDFGDGGGRLGNSIHQYDDSYDGWRSLMYAWAPLTIACTKPEAHLYAFCDIDRFHELKSILAGVGWDVFRTPFVIRKINSGRVPRPEHGPRRQYELCLYAIKGGKRVTQILPDVLEAQADDNLTHGAQKPVAIYTNLLSRTIRPGDEVLDCFSGSGTLLAAGHPMKVRCTLMEREPEYFAMGLKRAERLRAQETGNLLAGL